jgi:hypothetical protein
MVKSEEKNQKKKKKDQDVWAVVANDLLSALVKGTSSVIEKGNDALTENTKRAKASALKATPTKGHLSFPMP